MYEYTSSRFAPAPPGAVFGRHVLAIKHVAVVVITVVQIHEGAATGGRNVRHLAVLVERGEGRDARLRIAHAEDLVRAQIGVRRQDLAGVAVAVVGQGTHAAQFGIGTGVIDVVQNPTIRVHHLALAEVGDRGGHCTSRRRLSVTLPVTPSS